MGSVGTATIADAVEVTFASSAELELEAAVLEAEAEEALAVEVAAGTEAARLGEPPNASAGTRMVMVFHSLIASAFALAFALILARSPSE